MILSLKIRVKKNLKNNNKKKQHTFVVQKHAT